MFVVKIVFNKRNMYVMSDAVLYSYGFIFGLSYLTSRSQPDFIKNSATVQKSGTTVEIKVLK